MSLQPCSNSRTNAKTPMPNAESHTEPPITYPKISQRSQIEGSQPRPSYDPAVSFQKMYKPPRVVIEGLCGTTVTDLINSKETNKKKNHIRKHNLCQKRQYNIPFYSCEATLVAPNR